MMITPFGRMMRNHRIKNDWILWDMSKMLGLGLAHISGIECGRTPLTQEYVDTLLEKMEWTEEQITEIKGYLEQTS